MVGLHNNTTPEASTSSGRLEQQPSLVLLVAGPTEPPAQLKDLRRCWATSLRKSCALENSTSLSFQNSLSPPHSSKRGRAPKRIFKTYSTNFKPHCKLTGAGRCRKNKRNEMEYSPADRSLSPCSAFSAHSPDDKCELCPSWHSWKKPAQNEDGVGSFLYVTISAGM